MDNKQVCTYKFRRGCKLGLKCHRKASNLSNNRCVFHEDKYNVCQDKVNGVKCKRPISTLSDNKCKKHSNRSVEYAEDIDDYFEYTNIEEGLSSKLDKSDKDYFILNERFVFKEANESDDEVDDKDFIYIECFGDMVKVKETRLSFVGVYNDESKQLDTPNAEDRAFLRERGYRI